MFSGGREKSLLYIMSALNELFVYMFILCEISEEVYLNT